MRISYPYQYTETVIPPRCRKARPVRRDAVEQLTIRTARLTEAPVAIVEHGHTFNRSGDWARYKRTYRFYRGRFYIPYVGRDDKPAKLALPAAGTWDFEGFQSRSKRRAALQTWSRQYLIINGRMWSAIGEPRYVIQTFGLPRNHGGTALLSSDHYNPNIANHFYYRLDQLPAAIAAAERIATQRGDTLSQPIRPSTRFELRMPTALRLNPRRQHGQGNDFLNRVHTLTTSGAPPVAVGLAVLGEALRRGSQ